ncbi:MAG: glycoside hydrolase family 3 N-terminal domain-containing protein [Bacteroidales bacterium]
MKSIFLKTPFLLSFLFSISGFSQYQYPFQDPTITIEIRIKDLLDRLTLEEKALLMLHNNPAIDRLGIPAYNWWNESLHGVARAGRATVFPQAIGLAATFDEDLIFNIANAISDEARAKHNAAIAKNNFQQYTGLTFWSPNVNIFRDPRWGRGQETYGEDPFLTSRIGVAYVKGMQGNDPNYLKVAACAKHFVVHSGPEETRHGFNAIPNEIDLYETYLPAFKSLVDIGVESVMCAYNQLYGEPCCGNKFLLTDLLRNKWNFKGHIVTDCWAINDFITHQKIVDNGTDAAVLATNAGVNLNCGMNYKFIPDAVKGGKTTEQKIDSLLTPLLRTRIKLGLLDNPQVNPYSSIQPEIVNCKEHKQLAYEAAVKSIVLLKNEKQTLPLKIDKLKKIFLTGPTMSDNTVLLGNYNGFSGNLVTFLEGIINKVDVGTIVDYNIGTLLNNSNVFSGLYLASDADVIIASIGNTMMLEGENGDAILSTSGGDRNDLKLPENQIELLRKLKKQAPEKPLIVIVTGGSAIDLKEISELSDALLFVWYPGEQGGNALADILFGNQNPSGRLPVTFYENIGDLPAFDNYSMENRTYRFFKGTPLYSFGYGLSYSTFQYSNAKITTPKSDTDEISFAVTIKNTGFSDGEEVVQLYVVKPALHERNPIKTLCGFKRVFLKAGESKQVTILVNKADLKAWDINSKEYVLTKGSYAFQVGSSSADIKQSIQINLK